MKPPIDDQSPASSGPRVWAGIEELSDDPKFQAFIDAEFPAVHEFSKTARRQFLKLMGASFALAGLTGCEKSSFVAALPYVDQPESEVIGLPRYYATAVLLDGYAQPVIATTHSGRPTKLDGNPDHPVTRGRSDVFMQGAVLQLYDPDRAAAPSRHGEPVSWADVDSAVETMREGWKANQGEGVRLLLGPTTSPTLLRQIDAILKQFPKARVHAHTATGLETKRQIMAEVYGQAIDLHYELANCDVVVGLDDDFLGPGPDQVRYALGWSQSRRRFSDRPGNRLFMAESVPSATGALANHRLIADARRMPVLAEALAHALGVADAAKLEVTESEARWIARVVTACKEGAGRSLFVSGLSGGAATALWIARINQQLGNAGQTVKLTAPIAGPAGAGTLAELVSDINAGHVSSLVVLGCNPAYTAPGELDLGKAIKRVHSSLHIGLQRDETGKACEWQLPLAHALESWSDARAVDGTATILQPVISPFHDVRTVHQTLAMLLGEVNPPPDAAVRETWQEKFGDAFDARWKQALHDGFVEGAAPFVTASPAADGAPPPPSAAGDLDIVFRPDPTIWDGQYANVGWLQELPKTLTTVTWSNVIAVSPALAKHLAAANGDHVEVAVGKHRISGPLWIMPGQADNTVALYLGYGRTRAGRVGDGLGYNAYQVRPDAEPWLTQGSLRKLDTREDLPITQLHHRMEGFDFAREVSPDQVERTSTDQASLYAAWPPAKNAWGMVIDLDSCIGCNACVAACTAENNVPVVGPDQVRAGREMHWLRIARYYTGDIAEPRSFFEPVPCMHCEDAPCEMGCPVHATTHSPEGVNQMVYNRCIGTRTCSSYCPYKVRRFNFYDYRAPADSPTHAAHNPEVTVRSRGVMEKCTYCTQRIEAAHVAADREKRAIRDGEVVTACQQACPTKAIVFGDINDPNSEVARLKRNGRHYVLLEEQGTRPRTTYLARWREDETESRQG